MADDTTNDQTLANAADKAAADEDLFDQVVTSTSHAYANLGETLGRYQANPDTWPKLVAHLHWFGTELTAHAERLGQRLADHAQRWPTITVPPGGPSVLVLPDEDHYDTWATAARVDGQPTDDSQPELHATPNDYATALATTYGRPELDQYAEPITADDGHTNGIAVVFHLLGDASAVVRVVVGGIDPDDTTDHDAMLACLDRLGIEVGPPVFLPPFAPDRTFYSLGGDEALYDAYGRHATRTT